jgi:hypothetical protein
MQWVGGVEGSALSAPSLSVRWQQGSLTPSTLVSHKCPAMQTQREVPTMRPQARGGSRMWGKGKTGKGSSSRVSTRRMWSVTLETKEHTLALKSWTLLKWVSCPPVSTEKCPSDRGDRTMGGNGSLYWGQHEAQRCLSSCGRWKESTKREGADF